jgi:hypothetical protein
MLRPSLLSCTGDRAVKAAWCSSWIKPLLQEVDRSRLVAGRNIKLADEIVDLVTCIGLQQAKLANCVQPAFLMNDGLEVVSPPWPDATFACKCNELQLGNGRSADGVISG